MTKTIFFLILLVSIIFSMAASFCLAAEGGARPLALGGAYTAVAEDANAATWNPGAMAVLENNEFTYSLTVNNRKSPVTADFAADDYVAFVEPLKFGYGKNYNNFGVLGVYYMDALSQGANGNKTQLYEPGLSYGIKILDNLSIGASINYQDYKLKVPTTTQNPQIFAVNLGMLWDINQMLAFGVTVDNVNEPKLKAFDVTNKMVRTVRPGIAVYPTDQLMVTCDIFDLSGATRKKSADFSQDLRLGMEYYVSKNIALRVGGHHLLSEVDQSVYYSAGVGLQQSSFLGIYPIKYYLDYGLLYWPDVSVGMEEYLHELAVSFRM